VNISGKVKNNSIIPILLNAHYPISSSQEMYMEKILEACGSTSGGGVQLLYLAQTVLAEQSTLGKSRI
jgi:hypothetical protein